MKIAEATVNVISAPQIIGLRDKIELNKEEKFRIINVNENRQFNVIVVNPQGKEQEIKPSERVGNTLVCFYRPIETGLHSLNIFLDRESIPGSPFPIRVIDKSKLF